MLDRLRSFFHHRRIHHTNEIIASQQRQIEKLQVELRIARESLAGQIEVNRMMREWVAWGTATFVRQTEEAKNWPQVAGIRG